MTVYSTTIQSSPANSAGQVTTTISSEQMNGGNYFSSEDFETSGPSVIDGQTGVRKSVFSTDDLNSSDMIEVAGVPMTVAQAKAAGINVTVNTPAETPRDVTAQAPGDTEPENVDARRVDDGHATDAEVIALDSVASAVELHTGLDRDATLELGKDILMGQIPEGDQVWDGLHNRGISPDAARASVGNVVQAGQAAAMRELGQAEYQELSDLADNSAAIKGLVINHGIKRMSGKSKGVTWKQVLTLARQFARA